MVKKMSKVANMLNMVQILKDKKVHSIKELADILEVSERMIRLYKSELEQAGIYIHSVKGIYGGYQLNDSLCHIDIGLTHDEIDLLTLLKDFLINSTNFPYPIEYQQILTKIKNSYAKNQQITQSRKLKEFQSSSKNDYHLYNDMRKAIQNRKKVLIHFFSTHSAKTTRIIHPAELFYYNNEWYIAAFCELRNEIRLFRLQDIESYEILKETYLSKKLKK